MPSIPTPMDKENFPDYTSKFSLSSFEKDDNILESIMELESQDLPNDARIGEDK